MSAFTHRLSDLVAGFADIVPMHDVQIAGLASDSRAVQPGALFLAWPGARADGRAHVRDAIQRGAAAVAFESAGAGAMLPGDLPGNPGVPAVAVRDLHFHAGTIADRFFGSPSKSLFTVGVTGTNGKTTCTHLAAQALDRDGARCALIGTLGNGFPGALEAGTHTTPDAIGVHGLLRGFLDAGARSVCMEVSSHALDQGRVHGVAFDCAVFTNLTRDHLDYHGTLDAYAEAKQRLFEFDGLRTAVINRDDDTGRRLLARVNGRVTVLSFGFQDADVCVRSLDLGADGIRLEAITPEGDVTIESPLIGRFNAANLLAVLAVLLVAGLSAADAAARLARAHAPAGRMERFGGGRQPLLIVDYAHTPDALEKALAAAREHTGGRVVCVFGCGGDRDRGKRPLMGEIAEREADAVILTDDNPRHEDGDAIISDIAAGMRALPVIVRDRARAIATAVTQARAGDVVLIAGKGHEAYQQIGDERLPFSDRLVAQSLLREAA